MHQLVNKDIDNINMHGKTVKKKQTYVCIKLSSLFAVEEAGLGQVVLRVFLLCPVSIIPSARHSYFHLNP